MPIQFACSQCQKKMKAPDGTEGKKARCPACSAITRIPGAAVAAASVPVAQVARPAKQKPTAPAPQEESLFDDNPFAAPATADFSAAPKSRSRSGGYLPTWEDTPSLGNFFKSTKEVLMSPANTFRNLKREGELGRALKFAALGAAIMGALIGFTQGIFAMLAAGDLAFGLGILVGATLGGAIFYPIFAVIGCYVGGAILHLLLSIFGATTYGYNATIRSVAYMQMSSWPFMVVPILGPIIGGFWMIAVQIIGLAEVHETTKLRVALAVFSPILLFIVLGIVLAGIGAVV